MCCADRDSGSLEQILLCHVRHPLWVCAAVVFVFGAVLAAVGGSCMQDALAGVKHCPRRDGLITLIVGSVAMFASAFPAGCVWLWHSYRDVVRRPDFIAGAVLFVGGVVTASVGLACFNNTLEGVAECDRTGKWSAAQVLTVLGSSAWLCGIVSMGVAWLCNDTSRPV